MSATTINIPENLKRWQDNFELLDGFLGKDWGEHRAPRKAAMAEFLDQGFPSTKWEEWKYTSVRSLSEAHFTPVFRLPQHDVQREFLEGLAVPPGEYHMVVLVDGHFDAALSKIMEDDGLSIRDLKDAVADGSAEDYHGKIAQSKESPFIALSDAMSVSGIYIHVQRGKTPKSPVCVVHLSYSDAAPEISAQYRQLIVLEENAALKVVENDYRRGSSRTFANKVSEIHLAQDARMELYQVQNNPQAEQVNFCQVQQGQGSHFQAHTISLAGKLVRNNLHVRHTGEHCETHLYGLYLLDGEAHVDNHTLVDHAQPNCFSNELYKGVLDGNSTAVFNGKVMVRPDAQKTNAFQSNKTILLSDGATINTKPQLEIFADDVKCSHGATTGRLDETALFYLRSRGLSEKRAKALLIYAFASEVLETVSIPELKEDLQSLVEDRLVEPESMSHA